MLIIGYVGIGQVDLNSYKYIIIPKTLGEFEKQNQYLTSTLLKHEFVQNGFTVEYEDALPEDLLLDTCLGLTAMLKDDSSMFRTKISIVLEDCQGRAVYSTLEGSSTEKEYTKAYKEAIQAAMESFTTFDYSYSEKDEVAEPITLNFKNDVKSLASDITASENNSGKENRNKVIQQTSTLEHQSFKSMEPVTSNIKQATPVKNAENKAGVPKTMVVFLYAQPIPNGYQLMDDTSKVIMKIRNSSTKNVFIGQDNTKSGIVFKNDSVWIFEYYSGAELVQEELHIKF